MIAAATAGHALARAGLLFDALLAAAALCTSGRVRRLTVAIALVLTPVLLGATLWKSSQVVHLRHHHLLTAVGIVAAVAVAVVLAFVYRSRPALLALSAVVALPFRFSLISGGTGGVLLILYAVIGGGALALVAWGEEDTRENGLLERALAAFVVLYAVQALYTPDLAKAAQELCFFYVPFSLLFVLLARVRWDAALLRRCAYTVVALALLFVAVAAVEYASRRLLFQASLNSNERYFRVNSLFYDPNIYGRFLALTIVLVVASMMWERNRRAVLVAAAVAAVLWLGLLASVSQSSIIALLVGLVVIAAARFPPRAVAAGAAMLVAVAVVVAIALSGRLHLNLSDTNSANNSTGGRASLVTEGADLFADRPLAGFGSGSFSCEYLRHASASGAGYACGAPTRPGVTSESHTTPITIAAEQGVLGLLAYLALLGTALLTLTRRRLRAAPVRVAILAAFAALVVHTWAYADFLEDPIAWALLAIGAALARD
jgi:O-antigen ligase